MSKDDEEKEVNDEEVLIPFERIFLHFCWNSCFL